MLEFDGQALDPAIVSAQPMKSVQTVDLQQMGCPSSERQLIYLLLWTDSHKFYGVWSGHGFLMCIYYLKSAILQLAISSSFFIFFQVTLSESRLPQTSAVSGPQESSQVSRVEAHQEVVGETWLFWFAWKSE